MAGPTETATATAIASPPFPPQLSSDPAAFLTPTPALHAQSLAYISALLTPVAAQIASLHARRTTEHRASRKRKRGQDGATDGSESEQRQEPVLRPWSEGEALKLAAVHVEGFGVEQVWEQVRRVVLAVEKEVERDLEVVEESGSEDDEDEDDEDEELLGEEGRDYIVEGVDDDEDARPSEDEDEEGEESGVEVEDETMLDGTDEEEEEGEDDDDDDDSDELVDDEEELDEAREAQTPATEYVEDPNGLNDGFFSIDDFNKQSDFLERADARGEDDGAASDEEEVDWNLDPLAEGTAATRPPRKAGGDDDASADDDGPTFGDMDLDAPEGASDDDEDELEGGDLDELDDVTNANNVMYTDFFAPPAAAKKTRKNKKGRPHPHNFPAKAAKAPSPDAEDDVLPDPDEDHDEAALSRLHRDLFSDEDLSEESAEEEDADGPTTANGVPRGPQSSHERRRAALNKEISTLERTLVSAKPWALSGEASSAQRPLNSLLEEDLGFERTGKPVPVITAELSASIEALIKTRILGREFDDIVRRRPDDLAVPSQQRARYDLADTKSKKSLAQLYEEDHLASTSAKDGGGGGGVVAADTTDAERAELAAVAALWDVVRSELDSLSNFSLRPKKAAGAIEIRTDAPVARMEDARPNAVAAAEGGTVDTARLAPGEVFRIEEGERDQGEMLAGGRKGEVVARDERERGEGKRARRRAKERGKKRAENAAVKTQSAQETGGKKKRATQDEVVGQLKKGGVRVIGKKGELTDVDGNRVKEGGQVLGAGAYKL